MKKRKSVLYSKLMRKKWDYIAVPYPEGYESSNRGGELGNMNIVFFNHMDIEVIK